MENLWSEIVTIPWTQIVIAAFIASLFTPIGNRVAALGGRLLSSLFTSYRRRRKLHRAWSDQEVEFLAQHSDIRGDMMMEAILDVVVGMSTSILGSMAATTHPKWGWAIIAFGQFFTFDGFAKYSIARAARNLARHWRTGGAPLASSETTGTTAPGAAP